MAEMAWEKPTQDESIGSTRSSAERWKFLIGGALLLGAVAYLLVSGTLTGAQYFLTVESLLADEAYDGQTVRISGAVIGDTIVYDSENLILDFTVAHIPTDTDDLALTLYQAVNDPDATHLSVHIENIVKPDLLTNEAQAIMTGTLGEDGVFYANELLLKCPSRYEEDAPDQAVEVSENAG
jgi:cytochrome c-type biogenesis protein CcmE